MHRLLIAVILIAGVAMSGCTKQETRENLRNVKGGLKNTWHHVKEGVANTAEEFNEKTR